MASNESGFFESSFERTRSLIRTRSIQPRFTRRSLQVFSQKKAQPAMVPTRRPSKGSARFKPTAPSAAAVKANPVKRGMSSSRGKPSRRPSGTVIRTVPQATPTAPLTSLERDMATLPNEEILISIGRISPVAEGQSSTTRSPSTRSPSTRSPSTRSPSTRSPSTRSLQSNYYRSVSRNSNATALSPIKAGTEMKFFSSSASLSGVIGTYKQGRLQLDHKDGPSPGCQSHGSLYSRSSSSTRSRRPRIQVVIPDEQRDRPLPTSPFFSPTNKTHFRSASAEIEAMHNISPPSGSKQTRVRNSIVSPMSAQQQQMQEQISVPIQSATSTPELGHGSHPSVSNSSDESHGDDGSSIHSTTSSVTSEEAGSPPLPKPATFHQRSASAAISSSLPTVAENPDSPHRATLKSDMPSTETGLRVASCPTPPPRRYLCHPPLEHDITFQSTCAIRPARKSCAPHSPPSARKSSVRSNRRSLASNHTMGAISQALNRSASREYSPHASSPTLSEAENDLEQHLTSFTEDNPFKWDDVVIRRATDPLSPVAIPRKDSLTIDFSKAAPAVPRKSSKRLSQISSEGIRISRVPADHIASQLKRNKSLNKGKGLKITIPDTASKAVPEPRPRPKRITEDFVLSPIPPPRTIKRLITPAIAENVILSILRNSETLDDLFSAAIINVGFYRVFKRHELDLMKSTLRKVSPAAWEHREIAYPGHDIYIGEDFETPRQDYTAQTYYQYHKRDTYIIAAIKPLIRNKCQSFLRPEICVALASDDPVQSARVDDALWRIWNFCKIFGSGKGREEDIVAQMDWLKGGPLVHQKACTYSIFTTDDLNETLASAPEHFAKGNCDGLNAEELFDMMELWNCLGVLLQPFEGRTEQARVYGIYENTDIRGGDIDGEEMMLDEWYYYLLTMGLSAILELSAPCQQPGPAAFRLAELRGWVNWKPPVFGGTRRNFLKEAASRVYEDKITVTYAESSSKEVQRQLSKQRIQRHISELRRRKNTNERPVEVRMSQERPISEWEGVINTLTRARPPPMPTNNLVSHIPSLRSAAPGSALVYELAPPIVELPASRTPPPRPNSRIVAQPLLPTPPPSTVPSVAGDRRGSMAPSMPSIDETPAFRRQEVIPEVPSLEHHPALARHIRQSSDASSAPSAASNSSAESRAAYQQHPLQQNIMSANNGENSADKAVYRIVEMGFTPEQARYALRTTDLGDGLRVDRAVELLLRQM